MISSTLSVVCALIVVGLAAVWTSLLHGRHSEGRKPPLKCGAQVASVREIFIHPIKSCRGISVPSSHYTPQGLQDDRTFLIIDAQTNRFITARKEPRMVLIEPVVEQRPLGNEPLLKVNFPEDSGCPAFRLPLRPSMRVLKRWTRLPSVTIWKDTSDAFICQSIRELRGPSTFWPFSGSSTFYSSDSKQSPSTILSHYFGYPVHLVYKGPQPRPVQDRPNNTIAFQDGYPLLVLSVDSLESLGNDIKLTAGAANSILDFKWISEKISMRRFRPNIVLEGSVPSPFIEDRMQDIVIGKEKTQVISIVSKCGRCLLPNVDPQSGVKDKAVPSSVLASMRVGIDPVQPNVPCFGCNAIPKTPGVISVGDPVFDRMF